MYFNIYSFVRILKNNEGWRDYTINTYTDVQDTFYEDNDFLPVHYDF